jgi:drug/metabolite transporter (DMT)-like permease
MWVAIFSWPVFGERPTIGVAVAVVCAVLGVAVSKQADFRQIGSAHLAAELASIFTAIAMMGLNRLKGIPSLAVVVHFSAVSLLFCGAAFLFLERTTGNDKLTQPDVLLKLFLVGATATVGQLFLTKAFRSGAATKVSVVGLSQVVMVMVWESIVGGRSFNTWQVIGAILVLGPTAYLMARERKQTHERKVNEEPVMEEAAIE